MIRNRPIRAVTLVSLFLIGAGLLGCADNAEGHGDGQRGSTGRGHGERGGGPGGPGGRPGSTAVPVEVFTVTRRTISSFIETNGTLEAENEIDLVARVAAPITALLVEEGMAVRKGQPVARLDREEIEAQLEISRVSLDEATLSFDRAKQLRLDDLISEEEYQQALSNHAAANAQFESNRIQLGYTTITAPFDGLIVARYVDPAQQVSVNTPLFRISDFDPLHCPIQVPERELPLLHLAQLAYLTVEPWPDRRFEATVRLISPVVDAATGTIKVTLEVRSEDKLRPGMFARVFLRTATREDTPVIPKAALSLESIGDTVYVAADGMASRRAVELGFSEGDYVEAISGVADGELVVVVGHDGLSDGTPVQILGPQVVRQPTRRAGRPDLSSMSAEQIEEVKQRLRARGMTEEQIEARIRPREEQEPEGRE